MPLPERGGAVDKLRAELVRSECNCEWDWDWGTKGRVALEEVGNLVLELREWGRKPPRKDMSGSELADRVLGTRWELYWSCGG